MANALLSTINAARQRQPMCAECEKSLPNQIVFDKIECIIRLMQDEQNGLVVKTAKSFMSKIPSVFTGTDLIQWMMRNLILEDQQEAIHLANLIASHGYIFPIEDHTLSIKNDCTFYRFQTPCLWPSNNSDPENTDYAVYLCKRTMQGKTRLELADYEAENLARLQKMFSRKWEFIFMQAESQAKVDKKRDKLERKVLDSQERAFWDVYRPVPGCVNTTELDIKKACRLSKSAKRCSECQKVAAVQSGTSSSSASNRAPASVASSQEVTFAPDTKPAQLLPSDGPQLEPMRPEKSANLSVAAEPQQQLSSDCPDEPDKMAVDELRPASDSQNLVAIKEEPKAAESGRHLSSSGGAPVKDTSIGPARGHHHHQHAHHHHHHHHHHHPHQHHGQHQHGHHHHHRNQCPHYKHHQATVASQQQKQQQQQQQQEQQSARDPQLSIPAESILTTTVAASANWMPAGRSDTAESPQTKPSEPENSSNTSDGAGKETGAQQPAASSKKRSVGSADQFMRTPSIQVPSRRKSECNRMFSMTVESAVGDQIVARVRVDELAGGQRPASACCSFASLDKEAASSSEGACGSQSSNKRSTGNQSNQGQQMLRKSSLNILRSTAAADRSISAGGNSSTREGGMHLQSQHSPLKGTQSVCASATSGPGGGGGGERGQNIGELERELEALKIRFDRRIGGVKMSKVTQSYLSYFKQWAEYDPFIAQPIPSNPWISDSTELWDSERQTKDVHCRRVRRWAFSLKELLNDPAGREQFHRFLEKEFSAENLKFWDAVQELKRVHSRDVARRVEAIWTEYLAQDANCPINIDSKSYETSKRNMAKNKNNRYIFDEAAGHVYQLMKNDSYPRYLRSEMYKDYKEASEKKRPNQVAFDVFKPQITTLKHKFNF